MEEEVGFLTTFSVEQVQNNGLIGCRQQHAHVRFSFYGVDDEEESRTICLTNDILFSEESADGTLHDFILREGLFHWHIDADTMLDIADDVAEKVRRLAAACNLQVDICSMVVVEAEEENDDHQDSAAYDGCLVEDQMKTLKRKRIEIEEGEDGDCAICLEELTAGTEVAVMPCTHYSFHDNCLSNWLKRNPSCPLCRDPKIMRTVTGKSCS